MQLQLFPPCFKKGETPCPVMPDTAQNSMPDNSQSDSFRYAQESSASESEGNKDSSPEVRFRYFASR
jgi:hypothetical protein